MSAPQTPVHVSLLQKLLRYFELAASIGMVVPEKHVQVISTAVEMASEELLTLTQAPAPAPEPAPAPLPSNLVEVPLPAGTMLVNGKLVKKPEAHEAPPAVSETASIPPTS